MNKKKKTGKRILIFIGIIFILVGIFFVKRVLNEKDNVTITEYYSYNTTKTSNYYVTLKENMFYESQTMEKDKQYPSKLIDKIPFELKYNYNGSKDTNISYTYNVTAELIGNVKNGNKANEEVWNRKYVLIQDQPITTIKDKNFAISQNVDIDYNSYYSLVSAYEQTYLLSLDSFLKLKLNVKYDVDIPGTKNKEAITDNVEVIIPLNDTVTEIDTSKNSTNPKTYSKKTTEQKNYINNIAIAVIMFILGIIIIVKNIKGEEASEQVLYQRNVAKILKEYGDLIVTVTNKPDLRGLKTLKLAIIDDVIDLAEQNKCNIIHFETIKNRQSILYIIVEKYVYIYEITAKTDL